MSSVGALRPPRFEAVFNFRDLGGIDAPAGRSVRHGRLFRSGAPDRMRPSEVRRLFRIARLRTVIDLRGPAEAPADLGPLASQVTRHHLPAWDEELEADEQAHAYADPVTFLTRNYGTLLERFAGELARAVTILGDREAWPALIHCAGGKDRTGLLVALILDCVGIDEDAVVVDYLASEPEAQRAFEWRVRNGIVPSARPRWTIDVVQERALRTALSGVRARYGSTRSFFRESGVALTALQTVEEQLLTR